MGPIYDEALSDYIEECGGTLERLSVILGKSEKDGFDAEALRAIARDIHTIKGSSQLFGYNQIGGIAHAIEHCLGRLGDASFDVLPKLIECLYSGLDFIAKSVQSIYETRAELPLSDSIHEMLGKLALLAGTTAAQDSGLTIFHEEPLAPSATTNSAMPAADPMAFSPNPAPKETILRPEAPKAVSPANPVKAQKDETHGDTIRVHVDLLDNLMNLVGELVLIRNQILQVSKHSEEESLLKVGQRLNIITSELQNQVMKTRMQPIGNIMTKFHRVVRDTSKELGKQIELKLEGTETELDKTLIEAVRDPLTHIVRNAIDHGLESLEDRRKAGKAETGNLLVRSFHESGHVIIEVVDDGRGLDKDRIGSKAVERGLVTPEALARLGDRDIFLFIFLPGFSTAEKVSSLSGRGVGMDVVKTNIERIGGAVDLESKAGQGTTVRLRIPLTLAIIPALIVRSDGDQFAIPQGKLAELLRVARDDSRAGKIEFLQEKPVYRLRGRLLPLVCLKDVLSDQKEGDHESRGFRRRIEELDCVSIAVLNADRYTFGLIVDKIEDSADIVVKPIAGFLKDLGFFSGATIMGDGSIALTLDIPGIAERAGAHGEAGLPLDVSVGRDDQAAYLAATTQSEYLLVDLGHESRYAIPLSLVSRLEEFDRKQVKYSCEQRVVRYRETLLPLIQVERALGITHSKTERDDDHRKLPVVVINRSGRAFGLEVRAILDVVLGSSNVDAGVKDRDGILGALIDGDDIIVLLDVLGIIAKTLDSPSILGAPGQDDAMNLLREKHHLLVC